MKVMWKQVNDFPGFKGSVLPAYSVIWLWIRALHLQTAQIVGVLLREVYSFFSHATGIAQSELMCCYLAVLDTRETNFLDCSLL